MHMLKSTFFVFIISVLQLTNLSAATPLDFMNDFTLMYADENRHSKAEWIAKQSDKNCFARLESDVVYQKILIREALNWILSDPFFKPEKTTNEAKICRSFGLSNYRTREKLSNALWTTLDLINTAIELIGTDFFH